MALNSTSAYDRTGSATEMASRSDYYNGDTYYGDSQSSNSDDSIVKVEPDKNSTIANHNNTWVWWREALVGLVLSAIIGVILFNYRNKSYK